MTTPDVLYTGLWSDNTRRPHPGVGWYDEAKARAIYGAGREFRCAFDTPAGTLDRQIDYPPRDGRLWRETTIDYQYPDDENHYLSGVESLGHTVARFEPDGSGTVLYAESGNPVGERVDLHDAPVSGFWLDRPEFGDWSRLSDPMYGVPTDADVDRHIASRLS